MTGSSGAKLVVGVLGVFLVAVLLGVVALERVATNPETPIQVNLVNDEGPSDLAPVWAEEYASMRFCADATSPPEAILNGGETVGSVSATAATGYYVAADEHGLDYAYFDISSSGVLTVSTAGADVHAGMDGDRLYSFIVRATNEDMASDLHVAVFLDKTTPTNSGDGVC